MNRMKRRLLKKVNKQLGKVAQELRKREPEWKPERVSAQTAAMQAAMEIERLEAELMVVSEKSKEEIWAAVDQVQRSWMVEGMEKAALNHLLKLAKRGEWV